MIPFAWKGCCLEQSTKDPRSDTVLPEGSRERLDRQSEVPLLRKGTFSLDEGVEGYLVFYWEPSEQGLEREKKRPVCLFTEDSCTN